MRMYVVYTWLLGHSLNVAALLAIELSNSLSFDSKPAAIVNEWAQIFAYMILGSPLLIACALPSLFLSHFAVKKILQSKVPSGNKIWYWLIAAAGIVVIHAIGLGLIASNEWHSIPMFFTPPMLATFAAILFRYKAFQKLLPDFEIDPVNSNKEI